MRPQPYLQPMPVRSRIARPQPKGLPVLNMAFNELPYSPSPSVARALSDALPRANRYGSPMCDDLRLALGAAYDLDPEQIICGNGSEELLDVIARTFVRAGDPMVMSEFGYIQFALTANRLGARLIKAPEQTLTTDVDALITVAAGARLLFLANPNNPTGTMVPVAELDRLAEALPETVVVLDLAYGEFAGADYCGKVHELVQKHDNVVVTRTFSKAFGLAGVRAGWAHAPAWMIPSLYAARGMGPVNALAQAGALAGLADQSTVAERVAEIVSERGRISGVLRQMGLEVPESFTNFLLVAPGKDAETAAALVEHLFDECGIIVTLSREAGLERYFRLSLSLPEHNDLLIEGVRSFLDAS